MQLTSRHPHFSRLRFVNKQSSRSRDAALSVEVWVSGKPIRQQPSRPTGIFPALARLMGHTAQNPAPAQDADSKDVPFCLCSVRRPLGDRWGKTSEDRFQTDAMDGTTHRSQILISYTIDARNVDDWQRAALRLPQARAPADQRADPTASDASGVQDHKDVHFRVVPYSLSPLPAVSEVGATRSA